MTRAELMKHYFSAVRESDDEDIPLADREEAFILAARILTMVHVKAADDYDPIVSMAISRDDFGQRPLPATVWPADRPLQVSILEAFPAREHPSLQGDDMEAAAIIKPNLTAHNVRKVAGLTIAGTSNLRDHLRLNQSTGVVLVFHHTSFLKEHLLLTHPRDERSKMGDGDGVMGEKAEEKGGKGVWVHALPRELALETLYTIHLLFPLLDDKSSALLRTLIANQRFDPDCLNFGTAIFETAEEKERAIRFPVWGSRLMDLYEEIENPKPRTLLDSWLERKSRARHVMMVTIFSFAAAVLLGFLSLCVGIFQAFVAWEQWKDASVPALSS
ncbi:hypothetical protein B0T16DRAFT_408661 [Cercophora newfieldiana]|uniref:Uncharacterized protein n=1 Tax=Cercophora newfieldiana TaxID=92897 RepID=A0AA39YCY9_9PEZI|nr:hypothetical protein B0T16DRAFT_408661 [Cercophora newfieldiana]